MVRPWWPDDFNLYRSHAIPVAQFFPFSLWLRSEIGSISPVMKRVVLFLTVLCFGLVA